MGANTFWTPEEEAKLLHILDSSPVGKRRKTLAEAFPNRSLAGITDKGKRIRYARQFQTAPTELADIDSSILDLVGGSRKSFGIQDLANLVDRGPDTVAASIEQLRAAGHRIKLARDKVEEVPLEPAGRVEIPLKHLRDGKWLRFGALSDSHLCLPPNSRVMVRGGEKRISQVKVGDEVLTHRNRYRRVQDVITSPGDGHYSVVYFRGRADGGTNAYASLKATPNHPVLTLRKDSQAWVPIGQLRKGDFVVQRGKPCAYCDNTVPAWFKTCEEHDPFVRAIRNQGRQDQAFRWRKEQGTRHYEEDIKPEMESWEHQGFRVVPVDRVRPDFIAVKGDKILAVEVEAPTTGRARPYREKYADWGLADYYDDIVWLEKEPKTPRSKLKNRNYSYIPLADGMIAVEVQSIGDVRVRPTKVYNLTVEEDESYIAKRCVVHNCNRHSRLDVLNVAFDHFEAEGIREVFHAGNWIDGEARFNRMELVTAPGFELQLSYFLEHWPQRKGITTRFIDGDDHEGWYAQQLVVEPGRRLEQTAHQMGRTDLHYLGYAEADIPLKENAPHASVMRVLHGGGGASYAISYSAQKMVESWQGGDKPAVALTGHHHKHGYFYIRNVHTWLLGTLSDQSLFMRKRKIEAHLGFWVISLLVDDDGSVKRAQSEWFPFFDLGYYQDRYPVGNLPKRKVA